MSIVNLKEEVLYTYVPPSSMPVFKLTIERSDGTVDDVTSDIMELEVEDHVTESIGAFKFTLANPDNKYTGVYTGNEIVRYYKDYASTATTLRFRGRTEQISSKGYELEISGRSESLAFFNIIVNMILGGETAANFILTNIISDYAPTFTYDDVSTGVPEGAFLTINWYGKTFWECVQDLCYASGYECYVDADKSFHFFESGSVNNEYEAVVHNLNLLEIEDFTPDISEVRNRIIVYGANQEGVQIVYTAQDDASISSYGLKEETIKDDNITSYENAVDVGDYELSNKKDPPVYGSVTGLLMATIQPGERVYISAPDDNLPTGLYLTSGYKDKIDMSDGDMTTTIFINKEPRKFSHVMRDRIQQENKSKDSNLNPFGLLQSYTFLFDTDNGTHSNTSISDGYLIPGSVGGVWVSDARTLSDNLSKAYLNITGDQLDQVLVEVSGNGGTSYETMHLNELNYIYTATGTSLIVKVTFSSTSARVDSLNLLYDVGTSVPV